MTFETKGSCGGDSLTRASSARKVRGTGCIIAEWKACDVFSRAHVDAAATEQVNATSSAAGGPAIVQRLGALIATISTCGTAGPSANRTSSAIEGVSPPYRRSASPAWASALRHDGQCIFETHPPAR